MCFLVVKTIDNDKKTFLYDRFFVSNRNITTKHFKVVKNFK